MAAGDEGAGKSTTISQLCKDTICSDSELEQATQHGKQTEKIERHSRAHFVRDNTLFGELSKGTNEFHALSEEELGGQLHAKKRTPLKERLTQIGVQKRKTLLPTSGGASELPTLPYQVTCW